MPEPRFKIGDHVLRNDREFRIIAIDPRKRLPDEEVWYGLYDIENGEGYHLRRAMDAFDREVEALP